MLEAARPSQLNSILDYTAEERAEIARLELRQQVGIILLGHPSLKSVDRMLLRNMSGLLLRSSTSESALDHWHSLVTRNNRVNEDYTDTQLLEIGIPDEVVLSLYEEVQAHKQEFLKHAGNFVDAKIHEKNAHLWNDSYEIRQVPKRSLKYLRENGVNIAVPEDQLAMLHLLASEDAACPILDRVKNNKIVTINGFKGSKASLTIHDIFDHYWFYARLEDMGLIEKYSEFLQQVGNPQDTDIFSREGEIIASVAFDYRGFQVSEPSYKPLFSLSQVRRVLDRSAKLGTLTQNQQDALINLEGLDPESQEGKCLPYVMSSMAIELIEQRRKNGFIRRLDENFSPIGILGILDPEYIALTIESHSVLHEPQTQADKALFNICVMVEDYLMRITDKSEAHTELVVTVDDIEAFDHKTSIVPQERLEWIKKHLGFAASRRDLC